MLSDTFAELLLAVASRVEKGQYVFFAFAFQG